MVKFKLFPSDTMDRGKGFVSFARQFSVSNPLPTSCPVVVPFGTIYSDDFHRGDATDLGANYTQYFGSIPHIGPGPYQQVDYSGILVNKYHTFAGLFTPPNTDTMAFTRTGQYIPFPPNAKDQISTLTFDSSTIIPIGGPQNSGFSGRTWIMCRMRPSLDPLGNTWFIDGVGVNGSRSGVVNYFMEYSEQFNSDGTFNHAFVQVARQELTGPFGSLGPPGPLGAFVPRLNAGDTISVSAANFTSGGVEGVCVKGYINGVMKCQGTDFSNPFPGQYGKILTGGAGFSCGSTQPDQLIQAFACELSWTGWQAQLCNPNPF